MPREDEFNQIKVTNDKQLHGFEFGNTQNTEFSFHNVKKNGINKQPENELNDDVEETKISRRNQKDLTEEKDLIEQATESSNAGAPTTTPTSASTSASSSAGAAASSSSAAAATSGASAASTAAAAGTVVVAAFAVVTAAPIIMSNATATLHSFETSENEMFYEVELLDTIEDEKYIATLTNESYEQTQELTTGMNSGSFDELEVEQEYKFEIIEGSETELKRALLTKTFVTEKQSAPLVSEFRSFIFDKTANYSQRTFDVKLDFIDEKNIFSEFKFALTDGEQSYTYQLDKTTDVQHLHFDIDEEEVYFEPYNSFLYEFSYLDNGVKKSINSEERFSFKDTSGAQSTFTSASVVDEVDYLGTSITVILDYADPLGIFSNFKLHLSYLEGNENIEKVYDLDEISGSQLVDLGETLPYENTVFTYYFTYTQSGEQVQTPSNEIRFVDLYNRHSSFTKAELSDDARFDEGLIFVELSYVDELNKYDQTKPILLELIDATGVSWIYELAWENGSQSISIENFKETSSAGRSPAITGGNGFSYTINCSLKNSEDSLEIGSGTVTFTDSTKVSEFHSASINSTADLKNNIFYVTLDYVDGLNQFDKVEVVLTDVKFTEHVYELNWTTEEQAVNASSPRAGDTALYLDDENEISYTFRYYEVDNQIPITISSGTVTFNDPTIFKLTDFTIGTADFENQTFFVQVSYTGDIQRDVNYLELELNDPTSGECNYGLALNNELQEIQRGEMQDLEHGTFSYTLRQYRYDGDMEPVTIDSGTNLTFTDANSKSSAITGLSFTGSQAGYANINASSGEFSITLEYEDYFEYFQGLQLTITQPSQGMSDPLTYTFENVEKQTDAQVLTLPVEMIESFIEAGELNYSLTYETAYSDQRQEALSGTIRFKDASIVDFEYGNLVYDNGSYNLPFRFVNGEGFIREDLSLRINYGGGSQYVVQYSENGACYPDDMWQVGYFSTNDIEQFTSSNVTFEVYYSDETDHVIYSKTDSLIVDPVDEFTGAPNGDFDPHGVRISEYLNGEDISIQRFIFNGGYMYFNGQIYDGCNVHLKFVDANNNEYLSAVFNPENVSFNASFAVSFADEDAYNAVSSGGPFDVYLVYTHSNGNEQQVLCYKNFAFQV